MDTQPANADPFDLDRFIEAQAGVYERALAELKQGEKTSHWMWSIFPQIVLGQYFEGQSDRRTLELIR